jgi:hypothetical protein
MHEAVRQGHLNLTQVSKWQYKCPKSNKYHGTVCLLNNIHEQQLGGGEYPFLVLQGPYKDRSALVHP